MPHISVDSEFYAIWGVVVNIPADGPLVIRYLFSSHHLIYFTHLIPHRIN